MGCEGDNGLYSPSSGTIHKEGCHHRKNSCVKKSFTKGPRFGRTDAYLLYQSRWKGIELGSPSRIGEGKDIAFETRASLEGKNQTNGRTHTSWRTSSALPALGTCSELGGSDIFRRFLTPNHSSLSAG